MRSRLLPLLLVLMAAALIALGLPLAVSQAVAQQQRLIIDRIDDTSRFAAMAQYVTDASADDPEGAGGGRAEALHRLAALRSELARYDQLYGIRVGVFYRDGTAMAAAPHGWRTAAQITDDQAFQEALAGRRSHNPGQVWPWQHSRVTVASPIVRDGDVVAVVLTDSPTGAMRSRILRGWMTIAAVELAATLVAVAAAVRLTGWVLRPVKVLDRAAHDISTGRLTARVAEAGGPPELRRLARSFNEMADNVEQSLEQQRAFVADASHQLRNPLAALLLRIELLGLELPQGNAEMASVRDEGKRLATVLDDLLGLALAEHTVALPRLTDVAALVAERVTAWSPAAVHRDVVLTQTGGVAVTGWADPVTLSSALDAVVDNAVKFTPSGGRVEISVVARGETVTVTVADGGPGLAEDELARVGDRFWRSGRHQNVSGSGLGLSIARIMLRQGGGGLSFAPNTPHGLRVGVTVPRSGPQG